jgi:hypothetical protein
MLHKLDDVATFATTATIPDLFLCVDGEAIIAAAFRTRPN